MLKILYLDFLCPKGHARLNTTYISCLSKIAKVYVLTPKTNDNYPPEVEIIEKKSLAIKDGKLLNRLSSLNNMLISAFITHKLKPDYIFVSSYETMMFAIGRVFFKKQDKLFLLHHFNTDELENRVKRWFFSKYMRKVDHVVFEDFIKDYLIKTFKIDFKKIHVLPHQLNENISVINEKKYTCIGLSFSNDEKVISEIIDIERQKQILEKSKCKVILKSKVLEFDNGFLKVARGYLDNDEYNEYINNSQSIYMPFPLSFRYRMSGTLADAFSNNKVVLASNIPLIQYYSSKYPDICKPVNITEDFFEFVLNVKRMDEDNQSMNFLRFKSEHSEEKIIEAFRCMFE